MENDYAKYFKLGRGGSGSFDMKYHIFVINDNFRCPLRKNKGKS